MDGEYKSIKTLDDFKKFIKNKSVSVVGVAVSNISLIGFLSGCGVKKITARDKKNIFADGKIEELENIGKITEIEYILGENYLNGLTEDIIFKTPAIRRDLPELTKAANNGKIITSEIELFFMLCPAKTIAVTGSAGKTTTTALIGEILKSGGKIVHVGGNIGRPLLNQIDCIKKEDYAVLELSSFQLFDLNNDTFAPDYAIITNITPNHLDWHKNMDEYINAKKIIFKNQTEKNRIVLDFDDEITKNMDFKSNKFLFSKDILPENYKNGVYCEKNSIYVRENGVPEKIMDKSDIFIKGEHNLLNFMAAAGVTYDIAGKNAILYAAKNFKGVEHRIEFVCERGGVSYYNSSIDSTPTRTATTLNNFEKDKNIIVILGGSDKKISFEPLVPAVEKKAKAAVLYGATKNIIKNCLSGINLPAETADSFDSAVFYAIKKAEPGDIVLLSPACASFDCFKNFEERGNKFKELVKGLN